MAKLTFNKVVAGNNIVYQAINLSDGEYREFSDTVNAVSKDSMTMTSGTKFYKLKNRWCSDNYARSTVKLISVQKA